MDGHQRDRVAGLERRRVLVQVADVLVVDIYVDEAAQAAFVGEEMFLQIRVCSGELGERLGDGRAGGLNLRLLARVLAQRRRNQNLGHTLTAPQC